MFGPLIVCYLFLGGSGAGACLVSAMLSLLSPADMVARQTLCRNGGVRTIVYPDAWYRQLLVPGTIVGLAACGAGAFCLLADLGRSDRVGLLFFSPTMSYLTLGTWTLVACMLFAVLFIAIWIGAIRVSLFFARIVAILLVVFAFILMAYTGLLLQSLLAVPLWATVWLPILFVLSSLSCGIALVLAVGYFFETTRIFGITLRRLAALDIGIIACEIAVLAAYGASVSTTSFLGAPVFPELSGTAQALSASVYELFQGSDAWLFWGVFITGGLVVPFVLDLLLAHKQTAPSLMALTSATCVLVGGFILRYCIVEAGLHPFLQVIF